MASDTTKIILATGAGLVIGGIISLLCAPNRGELTRSQLRIAAGDFACSFRRNYNKAIDTITEKLDEIAIQAYEEQLPADGDVASAGTYFQQTDKTTAT